ncbi:hypothetical protein QJU83_04495 [Pasteurella skyensis]|uniref:hypothetical protein n=1 Tax=Phocoenobacter skyensis TaxID=97481 RepID=UPI00276F526D|nr:hypothetical protein [Pasteurella skyensis]MDP8176800.1 hypothetical protein [Pasteurella skyensis]MDP8199399.1 hypothetical protein [Pasteurella skyensis]
MKKIFLLSLLFAMLPFAQAQTQQDKVAEESLDSIATVLLADSKELQAEFAKMQADLSKSFELAKEYRSCLQDADEKEEAIECQKNVRDKAQVLGLEEETLDEDYLGGDLKNWTTEEKTQYLKELDLNIAFMEKILPCAKSAKNPLELMVCAQIVKEQEKQ